MRTRTALNEYRRRLTGLRLPVKREAGPVYQPDGPVPSSDSRLASATRTAAALPPRLIAAIRNPRLRKLEAQGSEPKPPPALPVFFMLSHAEEDGLVRMDQVKLAVAEVMGMELDGPKLESFAGALNALDFGVQLLVRQHPPRLESLRQDLLESRPATLPEQGKEAADSLQRLLSGLESREGILDRRFYAVCPMERAEEFHGLLARSGLSVHPLIGRTLRMLLMSTALGGGCTSGFRGKWQGEVMKKKGRCGRRSGAKG